MHIEIFLTADSAALFKKKIYENAEGSFFF